MTQQKTLDLFTTVAPKILELGMSSSKNPMNFVELETCQTHPRSSKSSMYFCVSLYKCWPKQIYVQVKLYHLIIMWNLLPGFVDDDNPYGKQDEKGTYYFEFSRPLRTMDQFQQVLIYYYITWRHCSTNDS